MPCPQQEVFLEGEIMDNVSAGNSGTPLKGVDSPKLKIIKQFILF